MALRQLTHFIDGAAYLGSSTDFSVVINPATAEPLARVPLASADDVAAAVAAAARAFPAWSATPPAKRAQLLFAYRDLLIRHQAELAELLALEHGKTLIDAKGSLQRGLEVVEFACGIPQLLKGSYSAMVASGVDSYAMRQALGVCVGITPFNFPAMVPLWMYPVAIACGNSFILKPSDKNPSVTLRLVELFHQAGLPPGVLNMLHGDKDCVNALLVHPEVQAVSFVGSTPVAEHVYRTASAHGKRVQALGGAKNHLVVMPDADFAQVADAIVGAAYGSAGERCMAVSAVLSVGTGTEQKLLEQLLPRMQSLRPGPYTDGAADFGPLITQAHHAKVLSYIESGLAAGACLLVDGRGVALQGYERGHFLGPCLFTQVTPDMAIYREEIFGPVLCALQVDDYAAAVQLVNAHEYGNGVAIFTRDGDTAQDFVQRIRIGMVGVNVAIPVPVAYHSFGGWKRSLFGDHAIHGEEGVHFYTRLKTITSRWPSGIKEGAELHFKSGAEH